MEKEGGASFNLASPARGLPQTLGPAEIRVSVERPRQVRVKLGVP
jgi:hypothetical protein